MQTRPYDPSNPKVAPPRYAGRWGAWNSDHMEILADSETMEGLWQIVAERELEGVVFEKIPRVDRLLIGRT